MSGLLGVLRVIAVALVAALGATITAEPFVSGALVTAVIALAVLALAVHSLGVPAVAVPSDARPSTQIDASTLVSQSDPDAAGHTRSRAPGAAATAA